MNQNRPFQYTRVLTSLATCALLTMACSGISPEDEAFLAAMDDEQIDPEDAVVDGEVETTTNSLFVGTSTLWSPESGSNVTLLDACWKNPTSPAGGANATERAQRRRWAQDAVNSTWGSSWIDFRWSDSCRGGEEITIYLEDSKDAPHTWGLGTGHGSVTLNHQFDRWGSNCQDNAAALKDCIERIAVHEFGHAIGMSHEQNRGDLDCPDGPTQGTNGDLPMSRPDPDSIMSYCPGGSWQGPLMSELDQIHVERLYGGWSAPVVDGGTFALRPQAGWFYYIGKANDSPRTTLRVAKASSRIQERDGSRNTMLVRKRSGSGRVHYGDEISLRDTRTGLYYCPSELTTVTTPACGQCQPGISTVKITAGSTNECWWTPQWTPSQVGGSEIHVNDPLVLKSGDRSFSGSDTASLRFLGHFYPPND